MYQTKLISPFNTAQDFNEIPLPILTVRERRRPALISQKAVAQVVQIVTPASSTPHSTIVFTQTIASDTWTINHNLGQFPSVTVVDPTGKVVLADVQYMSNMQIVVTFSLPFAGKAFLNF